MRALKRLTEKEEKILQRLTKNYLKARQEFLRFCSEFSDTSGNDNIMGRIGEYVAMIFLKSKGRITNKHPSSSNPGFDLLDGKKRISVKLISAENKRGRTTRLKEPWDELIIIELDDAYKIIRIGQIEKNAFKKAVQLNKTLSKTPIIKRTMLNRNGLIGKHGLIIKDFGFDL